MDIESSSEEDETMADNQNKDPNDRDKKNKDLTRRSANPNFGHNKKRSMYDSDTNGPLNLIGGI